jgi:hypothetical protein
MYLILSRHFTQTDYYLFNIVVNIYLKLSHHFTQTDSFYFIFSIVQSII